MQCPVFELSTSLSLSSPSPPPPPPSGAALALHTTEERGRGGQRRGGRGLGRRGGGGGEQGGVGAEFVDVDVGGVEQDVVLPAEAGEDGGDARHKFGERWPPLGLRVPRLDHHRVAAGGGERRQS